MNLLRRWVLLAAGAGALALGTPARACSVCGCGDPLLSASDPAAAAGRMRVEIDTEYLNMRAGNEDRPAATDRLDQYTLRLIGVYRPQPGLSLLVQVPMARKNLATEGVTGSDLTGLGDVELGTRYTLLEAPDFAAQQVQSFAISAGTSLPTGSRTEATHGRPVDEHGQLGTGGWGPYAGLHYRFERGQWTVFASATGRLRTSNRDGYRYGHALLWSFHGQFFPAARLALDVGLDARHAAADTMSGVPVENTGGTVLAASPGVYWNSTGGFWLSLRTQLPVLSVLNGTQWVGPTVTMGLMYQVW